MDTGQDNAGRVFFGEERGKIPHLTNFTRMVRRTPERGGRRSQYGQWSMDYHLEAAGEFSLDGKHWRPREAHTAHLYAEGRSYWERCRATDVPFPEMYLLFAVKDSRELNELAGSGGFVRFLDPAGVLAAHFTRLLEGDISHAWRGQAALHAILELLLGARPLTGTDRLIGTQTDPPPPRLTQRVEDHIRAHYHRPLTLSALARAAGVSVSTLTHRYRAETGQSPIGRLIEYRLDVARGMLLKGASLKAIAAQTGFYDEFHLSKAFRHRFGTPPRRYARAAGLNA